MGRFWSSQKHGPHHFPDPGNLCWSGHLDDRCQPLGAPEQQTLGTCRKWSASCWSLAQASWGWGVIDSLWQLFVWQMSVRGTGVWWICWKSKSMRHVPKWAVWGKSLNLIMAIVKNNRRYNEICEVQFPGWLFTGSSWDINNVLFLIRVLTMNMLRGHKTHLSRWISVCAHRILRKYLHIFLKKMWIL